MTGRRVVQTRGDRTPTTTPSDKDKEPEKEKSSSSESPAKVMDKGTPVRKSSRMAAPKTGDGKLV